MDYRLTASDVEAINKIKALEASKLAHEDEYKAIFESLPALNFETVLTSAQKECFLVVLSKLTSSDRSLLISFLSNI